MLCPLPFSSTDARAWVVGNWPENTTLGQNILFHEVCAVKQLVRVLRAALGCSTGENARSIKLAYSQWYFFLPFFLLLFSFSTPKHGNVVIEF